MPAKVSERLRATVTAGFAKLVEDVKKYAAPMYAPIANGAAVARLDRAKPNTISMRPSVATTSANHWPLPVRSVCESSTAGSSNMRFATIAPKTAPRTCAIM
jgi:hypothetical protein